MCRKENTMLRLSNDDVQQVLDMSTTLEALETGYRDFIRRDAVYRPRIDVWAPCDREDAYYRWRSMEGLCRTYGVFAIRIGSEIVHWPKPGLQDYYCIRPGTYCGLIMLFSIRNGAPLAILQDGYLQHMRVGGCAGLGAKYLAREDSEVVGILGSGGMARSYLQALCQVRKIKKAKVFSPTKENRERYAQEMSNALGINVEPSNGPREVVRGSDIVATCTTSNVPVVEDPTWISEGMHLTSTRGTEWGEAIVDRSDIVIMLGPGMFNMLDEEMVRFHQHCAYVAGRPEEVGRIPEPTVDIYSRTYPYLTDIMKGKLSGRRSPKDITFFINQGTQGLQFAAVAGCVYHLARQRNLGKEIPDEWFLEDVKN